MLPMSENVEKIKSKVQGQKRNSSIEESSSRSPDVKGLDLMHITNAEIV